MISFSIFAEAGPIDNLRDIGEQTGFSIQHLISQAIAFLVVAAILQIFAYKPVRNILEQRRRAIAQSMADAERIKKELFDAQDARVQVIQKANEQAQGIIDAAQKTAAVRTEQLAREATVQAEEIVRKAREAAVLERDRLLTELKREIGTLVIQTTEKIAGKVLTSDDQSRLNDETLRQLDVSKN